MDKIYVASIKDTESNGMIGGFFSSTQNGAEAAVEVDQTGKPTAQAFMEATVETICETALGASWDLHMLN